MKKGDVITYYIDFEENDPTWKSTLILILSSTKRKINDKWNPNKRKTKL